MRQHGGVRFGLILLLVVILAGLAAGGFWWWTERHREYLLRLRLKPGDTLRYAYEMNMSAQGQTMQFSLLLSMKVLKVQKDGSFVIRTQVESGMLKVNGASMALPNTPPQTETYRPTGRRVSSGRVASPLAEFVETSYPKEPVKIGSTWSERQKAPDGSTVEAEYRVGRGQGTGAEARHAAACSDRAGCVEPLSPRSDAVGASVGGFKHGYGSAGGGSASPGAFAVG
jgi:hypothetical protein